MYQCWCILVSMEPPADKDWVHAILKEQLWPNYHLMKQRQLANACIVNPKISVVTWTYIGASAGDTWRHSLVENDKKNRQYIGLIAREAA